jgi:hypothetical protein
MSKEKKALDKNLQPIKQNNATDAGNATSKKKKQQTKEPVRKIPSSSMG